MKWFWFSLAVLATSVVLVVASAMFFFPPARIALASTFGGGWPAGAGPWVGDWHGGPWGNAAGFKLPAELQGLGSIPADQRFQHFQGAEVKLTDKDNQPLTLTVTPGKVTTASATSLALAANDGSSQTFVLDDKTIVHTPASARSNTPAPALASGDAVIVVTLNHSTTATAVIGVGSSGFGWFGQGGPWGVWHQAR